MQNHAIELSVQLIGEPDATQEELAELSTQLRRELLELNVDAVDLKRKEDEDLPEGAKAVDILAIGSLIVQLAPTALTSVVNTIQAWLRRSSARTAELTINGDVIKITGASSDDQRRLITILESKYSK